MNILLLTFESSLLIAGLLLLRIAEARRVRKTLVAYRLTFPRGLAVDAVEAFIGGLSGFLLPWWKRWLITPYAVLEVHANSNGIIHYLLVPEQWAAAAENLMQACIPSMRYESADLPFAVLTVGTELRLTDHRRSLRVDAADTSAKLLASLQPLPLSTEVIVQWMLTPHGPVAPIKVASKTKDAPIFESLINAQDSEIASAMRNKYDSPLLLAAPRIGVASENVPLARQILRRVEVSWHASRAPGVHLQRRSISAAVIAKRMIERRPPLIAWPATLNSRELAGLVGWPVNGVAVPGLALGGSRLVAASPAIRSHGTIVADSNFPGDIRPLGLDIEGRLRHVHILGPTGTGKSNLIISMAVQDMAAGYGLICIDPKGGLCDLLLEHIPENRRNDLILLDAAERADQPVVGFNPLASVDADHAEVVVENLVGLFKSLYHSSWGPRLEDILRAAMLTMVRIPGATLCELVPLLVDPSYRRRVVGQINDPVGLESFWGWYESISDADRQASIGPVLNKLRAFTVRPRVRSIIGQSNPKLRFREVLDGRKILLVSLATGLLGESAAELLGALIIAELWNATLARADVPENRRAASMAFIDEWQTFVHLPTPTAEVLAAARGLGLGMVLAHQNMDQLPAESRQAVLNNARSRVMFQLSSGDARLLARELGGVMTADDLQGLGQYEVAVQLFARGSTQPVATGKTRAVGTSISSPEELRSMSRRLYGVDRADVERQLRERQVTRVDAPTGRRRRSGSES
jgi:hypothetical protein